MPHIHIYNKYSKANRYKQLITIVAGQLKTNNNNVITFKINIFKNVNMIVKPKSDEWVFVEFFTVVQSLFDNLNPKYKFQTLFQLYGTHLSNGN